MAGSASLSLPPLTKTSKSIPSKSLFSSIYNQSSSSLVKFCHQFVCSPSRLFLSSRKAETPKLRVHQNQIKSLFTGIVEEMGEVTQLGYGEDCGYDMKIRAKTVLEDVKLGDSIAVNGTCLTVTQFDDGLSEFTVGLAPETLRKTSLIELKPGSLVNLERALQPSTRMGGHFVQFQELAGNLGWLIGIVSQTCSELESLKATREANQRLKTKLAKAKGKIDSLEDTLKLQQIQYELLRDRNLQLEEVLKTSVRATDIASALEGEYWDDINLCRRVMRLLHPQFPTVVFNSRNAGATCSEDLYGLQGMTLPSPSRPGSSSEP